MSDMTHDMMLYVIAAVCILIPSIILVLFAALRYKKKRHILLLGLCDSGKSVLFHKLVRDPKSSDPIATVTSLTLNSDFLRTNISPDAHTLTLVDIPGHEKVRNKVLPRFANLSDAFVFVIDSSSVISNMKELASFVYELIVDSKFCHKHARLVFACNKQDLPFAKSVSVIRAMLQRELVTVIQTRSEQLEFISGNSDDAETKMRRSRDKLVRMLHANNMEFDFDHLDMRIQFVGISATTVAEESGAAQRIPGPAGEVEERHNLKELLQWIEQL